MKDEKYRIQEPGARKEENRIQKTECRRQE